MNGKVLKNILFIIVLLVLITPGIQKDLLKTPVKPLKGDIKNVTRPILNYSSWFSGSFQNNYNNYLENHIGFRNYLVRLYNQLDFSIFKIIHAKDVIIGKENYLYEKSYIEAYFGKDFIGSKKIINKSDKIKKVQDWLAERGTYLIPVIAPGKGSFYPEYFPESYDTMIITDSTNYNCYINYFNKLGIDYLDFNSLFLLWKDTSSHVLYPRNGVHWSQYAVVLSLDTLQLYLAEKINREMVDIDWEQLTKTWKPRNNDNDIADGLNLLFPLTVELLSYPFVLFKDNNKFKPKVLVISDSFYWQIFGVGYADRVFEENDFWYYNSRGYRLKSSDIVDINYAYLKDKLLEYDFILTLYSARSLDNLGDGFYENAYFSMFANDRLIRNMENIRNDSAWLSQIKYKAKSRGTSVEEMLWMDALQIIIQGESK